MSNPFLGEIRMFGFTFAPQGWALCNGQTLAISQKKRTFNPSDISIHKGDTLHLGVTMPAHAIAAITVELTPRIRHG